MLLGLKVVMSACLCESLLGGQSDPKLNTVHHQRVAAMCLFAALLWNPLGNATANFILV